MQKIFLLLLVTSVFPIAGCAMSNVDSGLPTETAVLTVNELPQPVIDKIETEKFTTPITLIRQFGTGAEKYFVLEFADGSDRRYLSDGTETSGGIL